MSGCEYRKEFGLRSHRSAGRRAGCCGDLTTHCDRYQACYEDAAGVRDALLPRGLQARFASSSQGPPARPSMIPAYLIIAAEEYALWVSLLLLAFLARSATEAGENMVH